MGEDVPKTEVENPRILNLGCGFKKFLGGVNVDLMGNCAPDIVWDLNIAPWPWAEDDSFDRIYALHVFEHLKNWWPAFCECARVLKVGGILEVRVPDESSSTALTYRDHHSAFTAYSFHGIMANERIPHRSGTNAWALSLEGSIPLKVIFYAQVPFRKYYWMIRWAPWLLKFCAAHLRNFIWEQVLVFQKIKPESSATISEHWPPGREEKNERDPVLPMRELHQGRIDVGHSQTSRLPEMRGEQVEAVKPQVSGKG